MKPSVLFVTFAVFAVYAQTITAHAEDDNGAGEKEEDDHFGVRRLAEEPVATGAQWTEADEAAALTNADEYGVRRDIRRDVRRDIRRDVRRNVRRDVRRDIRRGWYEDADDAEDLEDHYRGRDYRRGRDYGRDYRHYGGGRRWY